MLANSFISFTADNNSWWQQGPPLTLQEIATQNITQQIKDNPDTVLDLPESILNLVAKEYYLSISRNLPKWLELYFEGISIEDLLKHNKLPAINLHNAIDLSNSHINSLQGFEKIPNIKQIQHLVLNLNNNRLRTLPNNFNPPNLERLYLSQNELQHLPDNFNPPHLHTLDLTRNQLQNLPTRFNPLNLQWLSLGGNPMSKETIVNLRRRLHRARIFGDY